MSRLALVVMLSTSALTAGCKSKSAAHDEPAAAGSAATGAGSAAAGAGAGSAGAGAGAADGASAGAGAAGAPATSLAAVQAWAPARLHITAANVHVEPATVGSVPGVELFVVTDARPLPDDDNEATLVGVTGGAGGKVVQGAELRRAVSDGKPDPKTLAQVALWSVQRDGDVLAAATTPEERKAKVTAPATKDRAFSFWVWTHEVPRSLEHGVLDLSTGELVLAPPPRPVAVAVAQAIATLNGVSVGRHATAVDVLADACKDATSAQAPAARAALLRALENHARVKTRVAVADQIYHCGSLATDTLIMAMEHDRASVVRQEAALALGRIGDSKARAALAKASRGEDANLAWAAKNALGKLK